VRAYQARNSADKGRFSPPSEPEAQLLIKRLTTSAGRPRHNDEDMLPPILDLPTSRALQSGETMILTRTLDPFLQSEHWSWDNKPTPLHGNVTVRCRVAWGRQPLPPKSKAIGLDYILKWQQIAQAKPIVVKFPE
jgi:hypothetical protein